jgi:hypothetical protein
MPDPSSTEARSSDPEREPAMQMPITETQQPDPLLQTSTGRMGAGGVTLAAIVVAMILGVVLYGLNDRTTAQSTAAAPSTTAGQPPPAGGSGNSGAATPGAPRANESGVKG